MGVELIGDRFRLLQRGVEPAILESIGKNEATRNFKRHRQQSDYPDRRTRMLPEFL